MNEVTVKDVRELLRQYRAGQSTIQAAASLHISEQTARRYRCWFESEGWLEGELPSAADIAERQRAKHPLPKQAPSVLEAHRGQIEAWRAAGANRQAIHQKLTRECGVKTSYAAVWAFIHKLEGPREEGVLRLETTPGEEAQVDFGYAGLMRDPVTGSLRKTWAFVMTLSFSRHMFVRFVHDQRAATWCECHALGFEWFGGVPQRIRLDNLKAAVLRPLQDDSAYEPNTRAMAEHYGFVWMPCRPYTPEHKGKVERGVAYLKGNFLPARTFGDSADANRQVQTWCREEAGLRTHGTTRQQPLRQFEQHERACLSSLAPARFEVASYKQAKLHRDCHISFEGAYYSAPARLIGETLSLRASAREITLYHAHEVVARHARQEPGKRSTTEQHLPAYKLLGLPPSTAEALVQAAAIGSATAELAGTLLADPISDRRRTVLRLLLLAKTHGASVLEQACANAILWGDPSPQTVRDFIHAHLPTAATTPPARPMFARDADELCNGLEAQP
jgi:transposase